MEATITAVDTARSLWIIYRQMSPAAQDEFKRLIDDNSSVSYKNVDWLSLSESTLTELWGKPEESYWDELYAKQHQNAQ